MFKLTFSFNNVFKNRNGNITGNPHALFKVFYSIVFFFFNLKLKQVEMLTQQVVTLTPDFDMLTQQVEIVTGHVEIVTLHVEILTRDTN